MVFGPVLGYISQYKLINDTQTLGNFSIDVCAILLTSNIMRLFYWYAVRFGKALLFQALLMIITQIILLHLCIKVRNQEGYKKKHECICPFIQLSGNLPSRSGDGIGSRVIVRR